MLHTHAHLHPTMRFIDTLQRSSHCGKCGDKKSEKNNTVDGKMLQRNNVVTLEKMAQRYNIIPLQHFFGVYFCLRDFCWCGGGF